MDKLKIDTQNLRDAASALKTVRTEFEEANANSDTLADAVGEQRLADRIKDFAHNWDMKRKDFVEDIRTLEKNLTDGADALEKTDTDLAAGLVAAPSKNVGPR
ncbi:MAG: hypothetical protein ABI400_12490 [Lacisediminihabitans sp.]